MPALSSPHLLVHEQAGKKCWVELEFRLDAFDNEGSGYLRGFDQSMRQLQLPFEGI